MSYIHTCIWACTYARECAVVCCLNKHAWCDFDDKWAYRFIILLLFNAPTSGNVYTWCRFVTIWVEIFCVYMLIYTSIQYIKWDCFSISEIDETLKWRLVTYLHFLWNGLLQAICRRVMWSHFLSLMASTKMNLPSL